MTPVAEKTMAGASYTAAGSAVLFGMTANELVAYIGAAVAVATFLVNLWFKWDRRQFDRRLASQRPDCATCPERETP